MIFKQISLTDRNSLLKPATQDWKKPPRRPPYIDPFDGITNDILRVVQNEAKPWERPPRGPAPADFDPFCGTRVLALVRREGDIDPSVLNLAIMKDSRPGS